MKKLAVQFALSVSVVISTFSCAFAANYTQVQTPGTAPQQNETVYRGEAVYHNQTNSKIIPITQNGVTAQSPKAILDKLKAANHVPPEIAPSIQVQQSSVLNAATNGTGLVITSSLLEKLHSSDERAFVISHELSHILLQHIGKTQVRRVGLSLLDSFLVRRYAAQGSLLQLASELGIGLVDKRSARGYEYQADDLGVKLMTQAGYDPQAAIRVLDTLMAATPGNQTPEFLQDHPITQSRIRALAQKYKLSLQ